MRLFIAANIDKVKQMAFGMAVGRPGATGPAKNSPAEDDIADKCKAFFKYDKFME